MDEDKISRYLIADALRELGCAACRLARDAEGRYLSSLLHEQVNDPGTRARLRASYGFCRGHGSDLLQLHSRLGVAILYRDFVETWQKSQAVRRRRATRRSLPGLSQNALSGGELAARLAPSAGCPACEQGERAAERALSSLVRHVHHPQVREAWEASDGLCLLHFRRTVRLARSGDRLKVITGRQEAVLLRIHRHLSEIIRKHDYRFQHEDFTPEERMAWERAVALLAGE